MPNPQATSRPTTATSTTATSTTAPLTVAGPVSARIISMWTARHTAQVILDGDADDDAVARLKRVLDLLLRAQARHLTVDLTRLDGRDVAVLELLAAICHRLWRARGCLHLVGLRHRLASSPEVRAFPELFDSSPRASPRAPTS